MSNGEGATKQNSKRKGIGSSTSEDGKAQTGGGGTGGPPPGDPKPPKGKDK